MPRQGALRPTRPRIAHPHPELALPARAETAAQRERGSSLFTHRPLLHPSPAPACIPINRPLSTPRPAIQFTPPVLTHHHHHQNSTALRLLRACPPAPPHLRPCECHTYPTSQSALRTRRSTRRHLPCVVPSPPKRNATTFSTTTPTPPPAAPSIAISCYARMTAPPTTHPAARHPTRPARLRRP